MHKTNNQDIILTSVSINFGSLPVTKGFHSIVNTWQTESHRTNVMNISLSDWSTNLTSWRRALRSLTLKSKIGPTYTCQAKKNSRQTKQYYCKINSYFSYYRRENNEIALRTFRIKHQISDRHLFRWISHCRRSVERILECVGDGVVVIVIESSNWRRIL